MKNNQKNTNQEQNQKPDLKTTSERAHGSFDCGVPFVVLPALKKEGPSIGKHRPKSHDTSGKRDQANNKLKSRYFLHFPDLVKIFWYRQIKGHLKGRRSGHRKGRGRGGEVAEDVTSLQGPPIFIKKLSGHSGNRNRHISRELVAQVIRKGFSDLRESPVIVPQRDFVPHTVAEQGDSERDVASRDTEEVEVKLSEEGNVNERLRDGRDESSMQSGGFDKEPVKVVSVTTTSSVN